jgi:alpha-glucosidase (family GH31 glycosyl hydrolase)
MYRLIDKLGFKTAYSCALFDDIFDWKKYDPTDAAATKQYWSLHVPRVNDGMDFWRQDNSERSWKYTGKETLSNGYEAHELFGSLWAKNVVEGMESLGLYGRPVISRGGPVGGHRYIVPWPGDLSHGLEFLAPDLAFVRNGGLAGYAAIAVDLGGFIDRGGRPPLEEQNLIRRTIDIIPIIPVSKCQGAGDASAKLPWLFTEAQQDLMRSFLQFRYSLHPYIYSAAIEAHLFGRPILAPLAYDYRNDPNTYDRDYTFMLGRQLLAAPVMEKAESREVYLPAGRWFHYWTGRAFEGPRTVTVDAPLYGMSGLPLFVKAGAVVTQMPEMLYIYEKKPEPLTLDVWPAAEGRAEWVLYDCESVKGPFRISRLACSGGENRTEISAGEIPGPVEIVVHMDSAPASVEAACGGLARHQDKKAYDAAKSGWYWGAGIFRGNPEISTVNIKLPSGSNVRVRHGGQKG